jgi:hypothetical protein
MQYVSEKELREAIRYVLENQNKPPVIQEIRGATINISRQDFWDALIQPWIDVLKIAKLEAQKTLANLLTLFRVMTSFNRQKQQNIMDNHKDRMRDLNAQTKTLLDAMPISDDMAIMGFLLNPGAAIANTVFQADPVGGVADFFRGAGFGDFTPSELSSPDRNSVARARKREQSGFISKALRGLNSLFMAGYDPTGPLLVEQEEGGAEEEIEPFEDRDWSGVTLTADGVNLIIDEGGGLPGLEKAQKGMNEDAQEFLKMVQSADKLVGLLTSVNAVQDLDSYIAVLDNMGKISPETAMASRAEIESSLNADAKEIASQEGADEEAAKMVLQKQGIKEPTEEELAAITPQQKEEQIKTVAFGNILVQLQISASESANAIYDSHQQTYDTLYNPDKVPAEIRKIVDDSQWGQTMIEAGALLKNMRAQVGG